MISDYYSYIVEELEDIVTYNFRASNNAVYSVYFSPNQYAGYLDNYPTLLHNGYAIGINRDSNVLDSELDAQGKLLLKNTIDVIIADFMRDKNNDIVLLYHCEHNDGKQAYRDRKFDYWYNTSEASKALNKEGVILQENKPDGSVENYYMGYLTPNDNPNIEVVYSEFSDFAVNLTGDK